MWATEVKIRASSLPGADIAMCPSSPELLASVVCVCFVDTIIIKLPSAVMATYLPVLYNLMAVFQVDLL